MNNNAIIKNTVLEVLPDAKVILFGSRARGTENESSDYDVLVITPTELDKSSRKKYFSLIHEKLVDLLNRPVDVLIRYQAEVNRKKFLAGHFLRSAMNEGILL
jgi:predicted nucleotidyltransferase